MAEQEKKLELNIVTPERQMVSNYVDQVNIPGTEGDLGILYDHAPILTAMRAGRLSYEIGEEVIAMVVSGGYLEVTENRVTVLAESAEFLHEVDRERAEKAHAAARAVLEKPDATEEEFREAQLKLFRAIARLEHTEEN